MSLLNYSFGQLGITLMVFIKWKKLLKTIYIAFSKLDPNLQPPALDPDQDPSKYSSFQESSNILQLLK